MDQCDIFISHASEDKADVATPLAEKLRALGLTVWLDEDALELGDPLSQTIDKALANSDFGVVILSPHYFAKSWTRKELAALIALEKVGRKVVLPVLHKITQAEVVDESPLLGGNKSVSTSSGLENVAQQIFRAVRPKTSKQAVEPTRTAPEQDLGVKSRRPKTHRWPVISTVMLPLLGLVAWLGYQQYYKPPSGGLSAGGKGLAAVEGEKSEDAVAPNPVTAPTPVPEALVDQQPARELTAYERALQMPGVEKVEGKQGSGSLKRVLDLGDGQELTLLWVEPGEFLMGSPTTEVGRFEDEPLHRVILTKDYFLGETEVTQGQWRGVMGTEPWKGQDYVKEGASVAASYVTIDEVLEFCKRLNESQQAGQRPPAGWVFGLPSEAQWEYACRAGTKAAYCSGDTEKDLRLVAVYLNNIEDSHAHLVRTKAPNDWGFFDMHGNVLEWSADVWSDGKAFRDGEEDPLVKGPGSAPRAVRGGSWGNDFGKCRSAYRLRWRPWYRFRFLGFRLCLLPGPGAPPQAK